jgi:hypothetical protein
MYDRLRPDSKLNDERVIIDLRVPGPWRSAGEVFESLARIGSGYVLGDAGTEDEGLLVHSASGRRFEIGHSEHDDELIEVFADLHHLPTDEELDEIAKHAVKIHLTAKGGSVEDARAMMEAATALVGAGGAGVFIDSTTAAHGRTDWLSLAEDTRPGGLYWAYIVVAGGEEGIHSSGMHCLGFRDAEMPGPLVEPKHSGFLMHNFLGYVYQSGIEVKDGDVLGGEDGPEFRVVHVPCTHYPPDSPLYNPFGMYRMEKYDD